MRFLSSILVSMLFAIVFGAIGAMLFKIPFELVFFGFMAISFLIGLAPKQKGLAYDTVFREVWTGEIVKFVTNLLKATFLDGIPDYSQHVSNVGEENQVIHLSTMQVMPDVLINNTTYPIAVQDLNASDAPIQLDKYNTKATPITEDELYALSIKKMEAVSALHGKAIGVAQLRKSLHALAPGSNTAAMPVLLTTGANDGTGRKRLVLADILKLKNDCDNAGWDDAGRRLVLCTDHLNDLLSLDEKFKDQYYNRATGVVYNLYGFEIHDHGSCPYYVPSTKVKKSFGAVPDSTDRRGSIAFLVDQTAKAKGWTKMYKSEAKNDPLNQRNLVNFRSYWIVLPTSEKFRAAIVSDNV